MEKAEEEGKIVQVEAFEIAGRDWSVSAEVSRPLLPWRWSRELAQ